MKSLLDLWLENEKRPLRVRCALWDYSIRYFEMIGVDNSNMCFVGILDNGEEVQFPFHSDHWTSYVEGMELEARSS